MKKYRTIDAATLHGVLASDERPVLVNALAREAFDEERIPGSISIPAASPTLAQKLVDLGFSDVADFEGGIEEWERAGHPLERARAMATA